MFPRHDKWHADWWRATPWRATPRRAAPHGASTRIPGIYRIRMLRIAHAAERVGNHAGNINRYLTCLVRAGGVRHTDLDGKHTPHPAMVSQMRFPHRQICLFVAMISALVILPTHAGEPSSPVAFDRIWDSTRLYENPDNPALQSFSLVGRYHGQYWSVDADQGDADGWENRRIIFGFQSKLYEEFKLEVQMHVDESLSPVYDELYVGFLEWAPKDKDFSISLGRLDYVFAGLERSTSSKELVTFERSALVNQLMPGEVFGLYTKAKFNQGFIQAGLFTGAISEEFGEFDSGTVGTLGVSHELPLFYEQGSLHLDYLFNDGDIQNTGFEPYQDIVSLWHQGEKGPWSLGLDITMGTDSTVGRSDVWGLTLLPTYDVSKNLFVGGDALELALRYHQARSRGPNGLIMPSRYERKVTTGEGDRYQAFYAGLNYLLYSHKLKFMAGAEYAEMEDSANDGGTYRGWTLLAGIRLYF